MPSSNLRDELPAHYNRVAELRRVAAAVIQSMGPMRRKVLVSRRTETTTRKPTPEPHARSCNRRASKPASSTEPRQAELRQIEGSAGVSAEQLRHLLREQRKDR